MPPQYLVAFLYYLSFVVLLGSAAFILARSPRSTLHRVYALSALALLGWLGTLYALNRVANDALLTPLGRANFACALLVVWLGHRFAAEIARAGRGGTAPPPLRWLLLGETLALLALTLLTPLSDRAERRSVAGVGEGVGHIVTVFVPLFPLYVAHLPGYVGASLFVLLRARRHASPQVRRQASVVGLGMGATAAVALTANVLLPYVLGNFAWQEAGALSTLLFLAALAWATLAHHLFNVRLVLRKTLVYGLLLALVVALYSSLVVLASQYLANSGKTNPLAQVGVLVIAFSFDPLRRYLEKRVDRLLFPPRRQDRYRTQTGHR